MCILVLADMSVWLNSFISVLFTKFSHTINFRIQYAEHINQRWKTQCLAKVNLGL